LHFIYNFPEAVIRKITLKEARMESTIHKKPLSFLFFIILNTILFSIACMYFYNIVGWSDYPDFGYGFHTGTGIHTVGDVTPNGARAGLRVNDEIIEINGHTYTTIEELRQHMRRKLGEENTYLLERAGRRFAVTIENIPTGFKRAFGRSGLSFLLGLCYIFIGVIVFLMKPHKRNSWIFYLVTSIFGLYLIWLFQLGTMRPPWLENLNIFAYCFAPPFIIQLALYFPEEHKFVQRYPYFQFLPHLLSIVLFIMVRKASAVMAFAPKTWLIVTTLYMALAVLFFLGSCFFRWLKSSSEMVRLRSKIILLGFAITASMPIVDYLFRALFKISVVPSYNYYLPFIFVFPVSVGYSIVKHDLFDIDALIKRTYGYVLTTGAIAGVFGLFVLISNLAFGSYEFSKTPAFPLIFILAIVFLFNPIRDRVQRIIDRVFYRLEYNYPETVQYISESMRTLLGLDEIGKNIMDTALGTMFIDSGSVMLHKKDDNEYRCLIQAGETDAAVRNAGTGQGSADDLGREKAGVTEELVFEGQFKRMPSDLTLAGDEPLIQKIAEQKKEVIIYDIQEDPFFEDQRESCEKVFTRLGATLIVPLIYEDRLTGLLSLGRKKSGKFYRHEDINLLNILANQGAVAIENARMVKEIIEKERLRTMIMDAFGKYVTPEVRDQILAGNIPLDGEAKEVTVLFADLRDFTTLSESTTPKEVVRIINGYFSEMADAIGQNHGLVLQFIGDEIEAVFGAPLALEDHPNHAVRAALAMQQRLFVVNDKLKQQGYRPLRHGIGIHTGTVVAANIGSEDRLSYAMVGDTVNLASRIQSLNKTFGTAFGTDLLISAATVEQLGDDIAVEKLPATTVKGKRKPVEVYKLAQTP
jgi:class 3 adenylate cyclase